MNNQIEKAGNNKNIIEAALNNATVKRKFEEVLGKKANGFISSLLSLASSTQGLRIADPKTLLTAAMTAATLDLPINPNLGFAYIVPYKNKKGETLAQYQMGYKGYIQLAMRSSQYKTMNVSEVYEGQITSIDPFTGDIERGEKISDKIVGYIAYFKMINGFEKYLYMTADDLIAHGKKYSQAYRSGKDCLWKSNFDAMAKKTVLKLLISKYGIMSIEMQGVMDRALQADQAVVGKNDTYEYVDNQADDIEAKIEEISEQREEEIGIETETVDHNEDDAALEKAMDEAKEET